MARMNLKSGAFIGAVCLFSIFGVSSAFAKEHPKKAEKTTGGTDNSTLEQAKLSGTNEILAGCSEPNAKTFLSTNNVKALIYTGGDMFWDFGEGDPSYEVPKDLENTRCLCLRFG